MVLTRTADRAISLEERTAIAEAAAGDLFVSLHANAARRRSVRGVETYYLDENHERHSLTVADLDGDGKVDIVAAARQTKNLVIFFNERP